MEKLKNILGDWHRHKFDIVEMVEKKRALGDGVRRQQKEELGLFEREFYT